MTIEQTGQSVSVLQAPLDEQGDGNEGMRKVIPLTSVESD